MDDGSRDDTLGVVARSTASWAVPVRVFRYRPNRGKGHALKAGFEVARGAEILFTDADLSTPIHELERLRDRLRDGCDVAIATRKIAAANVRIRQPWLREQMGRVFTWLVGRALGEISDVTCGFKLFRAHVGRSLFAHARTAGWSFDAEILALVRARGHVLGEVPVEWADQPGTKVRLAIDAIDSLRSLGLIVWRKRRGAYATPTEPVAAPLVWQNDSARAHGSSSEETPHGSTSHARRQRDFYDRGDHTHLRSSIHDPYAEKIVARSVAALRIPRGARVLELGAGFGRFTFSLLDHCASVVALDLSPRALAALEETRRERGVPESRCETICADIDAIDTGELGTFDFVLGYFLLHHLEDTGGALRKIATLVAPGGGVCFVEPNRRNPLFALQVACCADMSWREEAGMFRLSARRIEAELADAGLVPGETQRFGFFPPQIANRFPRARALEARLEQMRALRPALPFLALHAVRKAR